MKKLSVSMTQTETAWGWFYFVFQLLFLGLIMTTVNLFLPRPLNPTQLNIAIFILNFLLVTGIFWRFLWKNLQITCGSFFQTLKSAGQGFILYYIFSRLIDLLILSIRPQFSNANDNSISYMLRESYTLMTVCTVLLVPVVEETLYRGLLFRCLYDRHPLLGYCLSTALFCVIHVVGYIGRYDPFTLVLCFLQYIPAGVFLGWAYVKADSIWAPILIHMAVNQIGVLTMR